MKRHFPTKLLIVLENLFPRCLSCIKWYNAWSSVFKINFGVRQDSVLSPVLLAVYLDDLGKLCSPQWTFVTLYCMQTIILLISPSVTYTERLLHRCEQELSWLDMNINFNKYGPRCDIVCEAVTSSCNRRLLGSATCAT